MSINSIGSSSYASMQNMQPMQKPDPSKMAEDLFSKLDTKGQGYLEKTDLETALSKINDTSGGSSSADQMFAKFDSDGDGKVTKEEMTATLEQIASELDGPFPRMRLQEQGNEGMPPPPPSGGQQIDQGLTKDQLAEMASDTNSLNSSVSEMFSQLANNFSAADTNGDGKVTHDEAMAYQQANSSNKTGQSSASSNSTSSSQVSDLQFMKNIMQILHAYDSEDSQSQGYNVSTAV